MACIWVSGGRLLNGEIKLQGSKNAVLPMLAAALLIPGETKFQNCPDIADVRAMAALLKKLGAVVRREGDALYVDASPVR
ncbi:MAG: UDP-N-acetylglucosamine 1-carboxyvinyltransferase, partial [Lachnospiraceae bacterium]|nr:UDP-N-acetylglucosamine 1-carboxyvinyltransferase [Lachnospiraceae bacterium]